MGHLTVPPGIASDERGRDRGPSARIRNGGAGGTLGSLSGKHVLEMRFVHLPVFHAEPRLLAG
jgi:hypothetical protein